VLNPYPAKTTLVAVAVALSYMASWIRAIFHTDLGPLFQTWSLSVEEWFYVLWPVSLIALLRRRRSITIITVTLAVVALAYRLASESLISSKWYLFFAPDERAFELLLGCAIAVVLFNYRELIAAHTRLVSWCGIVGVAALAVLMGRPVHENATHHASVPWEHFGIPIAALASTALVLCVVLQPEHRIARALSLKPLLWVGRRSYGLYIYHLPILVLVSPLSGPEGRVPWRTGLISVVVMFSAAAASYRWLERPAMRWMRDREERVRTTPATPSVSEPAVGGILASGVEA
jgi:peptidoglycan/LPS O-acetylase OafA/YrhL